MYQFIKQKHCPMCGIVEPEKGFSEYDGIDCKNSCFEQMGLGDSVDLCKKCGSKLAKIVKAILGGKNQYG